MVTFSSKTFRKTLRRKNRKGRNTRKARKGQRGGGNTLNRNIPPAAVLANPISVDEYHGNNGTETT